MKRRDAIVPNNYYHIYHRGNNKNPIFLDTRDYDRFLFSLMLLQLPDPIIHLSLKLDTFVQHRVLDREDMERVKGAHDKYIDLINFCLMPNHFHLTVFEKQEGGIARYMQRLLNSHTKYHNTKYEKVGHLFQGPYQATRVKDDNHLSYLSAYIHKNPAELHTWKGKEHVYPWSSFQDYCEKNRWGDFLSHEIIMQKSEDGAEYKHFVYNSGAKGVTPEYMGDF